MIACSACGLESPPGARFCSGCGQPLQDRTARERRHVTVMFCDLVGSTALAERLDPEELSDLVQAYQQAASGAIRRYEGHVAQHLGDGLLVYFGYPVAHEDDARRAVHAGLGVLDALRSLNTRLEPSKHLAVRIGVHTGPVVTSELGSGAAQERLALGATPNVAARLQGIASPDAVVISGQTFALLKDAFLCEPMGATSLKGLTQAFEAYRVVAARDSVTPEAPAAGFVGRRAELEALLDAYESTLAGQAVAVLVVAEPGLGKSRVVAEFLRKVEATSECWVGQCSPYEQTSALSPVIALVRRMLGVAREDAASLQLDRVVAELDELGLPRDEYVPLLAGLLSVPLQGRFAPPDVAPQKRKELTLDAVAEVAIRRANRRPAVWLIEDLHWADPSTLEFLGVLMARARSAPLLVLMTCRPSFANPWTGGLKSIVLTPLDEADSRAVIGLITSGWALPDRIVDQIVERTDGVPLFIEELTKAILESGALTDTAADFIATGEGAGVSIPTSLQASLTARLDRLGSAKEVAQVASVIGREFSFAMLHAVTSAEESALARDLARLRQADLVHERGTTPSATYAFKHALIRDAAYELLLKSARRDYHRRIADALIERFPDAAEAQPELVARHFTEAGAAEPAVPYWLQAGQKAAGTSANLEAISHVERALALIETLPPSVGRDALELAGHLAIGPPLTMTRGFVVPEVERAYLRAQALSQEAGDPRQRFWIALGICQFRMIRGEIAMGLRIAHELRALAVSLEDPAFLARAHCILGINSCYAGQFGKAAEWLDLALAGSSGIDTEFLNFLGLDLRELAFIYAAWTRWSLGQPDLARQHQAAAIDSSIATGRVYSRVHALLLAGAKVSHLLGEVEAVRHFAAEGLALSVKHGFPIWALWGSAWATWATAMTENDPTPEITRESAAAFVPAFRATGARLNLGYLATVAAEAMWRSGAPGDAESLVDQTLEVVEEVDPGWSADLHRLKGELVLARARAAGAGELRDEALGWFRRALDIAVDRGSPALAARAQASLDRAGLSLA